ncbi:diaminopimelate epimerase [Acetohalobium arabaticum]|uniref:Diaminopimelate epimerase n=1 Tax=Acetohalobium arabaticum (strain ATCC 49924 / DSM 5501 / Z-7288) TaxID=574087 RepID=D9QS71_ACEAZ|nr:diaminopimelate epimerase [Acetohalobium arabaticum]ADL13362.1 diaminopimelate epimerase [Acetohalobium arabaticum DSM 5501]
MEFTKMHGLGNDFVMVNGFNEDIADPNQLAEAICDRHFGVGADGLVLILPSKQEEADFRMRIFNPDGSEPEMCGNAIRCFGKYLYDRDLTEKTKIRVETLAGIIVPELIIEKDQVEAVQVDMGQPGLGSTDIPITGVNKDKVIKEKLEVENEEYEITAVSMGNPHTVIFVDDADDFPVTEVGPKIEEHPRFPEKTNVEFIEVMNRSEIKMRVWERGAGVTLACGTGACGSTVASILNDYTNQKVEVHLLGGDLTIEWTEDSHVYMTGPAEEVFVGEWIK